MGGLLFVMRYFSYSSALAAIVFCNSNIFSLDKREYFTISSIDLSSASMSSAVVFAYVRPIAKIYFISISILYKMIVERFILPFGNISGVIDCRNIDFPVREYYI